MGDAVKTDYSLIRIGRIKAMIYYIFFNKGRHKTQKKSKDPTYNKQWSGVSHATEISVEKCEICGRHLHKGFDSNYCPYCDDFKSGLTDWWD